MQDSKQIKNKKQNSESAYDFITEFDQYLFGQGTHYDLYNKLGAHPMTLEGQQGVFFAVWAPNAQKVSVVGDFNKWDRKAHLMKRTEPMGIYELFIPDLGEGEIYKYCVTTKQGNDVLKTDPYAFQMEKRPNNASVVTDISDFKWGDKKWMEHRRKFDVRKDPMFVYEVHPGSWKKHPITDEDEDGFYNYRELAVELAKYVKDMGYTHVELMGIAEHPFDGSWGYQVTGYFAPTSRHGSAQDFQYFVNYLHEHKIGIILDWVPAHFPRDAFGLAEFDGTCLYEYADPRKGEHPDWGTKVFDYGKTEVKNFLICNALYWIEKYHIDGLRVDAVASMLYLDYGRRDGQWVPNIYGGNENLEAIEFFKHLNTVVEGRNPGAVMIAEESTAWPKVTDKAEYGGLNFSLKWNMGWMHDFLEYMKLDPYFRKYNHNKMTFAMMYAYAENYMLVLSHDEVVHLKCSMIEKMPGLYDDKFRNLMVGYAFMTGHPGKKLLFMGQDFGQHQEWSEARELDWFLLEKDRNRQLQNFVRALLHIYNKNKCLYEYDCYPEGFEWINANDGDRSIFSFTRHSENGKNNLLFVCNFTPVARPDYRVGTTCRRKHTLILNSDAAEFGGSGKKRPEVYKPVKKPCDDRKYSIAYDLPAYGVAIFKY
ncbi:MAG TPA: 1,4-alpha-glucan branching protein GlgB [Candidatus Anaerobutyricum faecale]|uniref:1,4-alpha-glucan branching protein GlgB n=1 Tax=Eubacterium sp. An11 TaxID=1965542 RepID=UPI000B3AD96B|nr:1,4-alpha-glucan branching protein GlgB [Eubacterium sp. An11]OUQ64416.1 1,4-alpha-glucan branching enzyme [Eubacterium sp. An11]HJC31543.1 1,4-alpha-glucan branching protein GlgB [Candidatus Anaerobutyricum faecale]